MARINSIVIETRLTRDPEVKTDKSGNGLAKLGLVHNIGKKQSDGSWANEPLWLDGLAFGRTADALGKLSKGANIVVTGQLSQDSWIDKQTNQTRSKLVLVVNSFSELSKGAGGGGRREPSGPASGDVPAGEELYPAPDPNTGEIPF